MRLRWGGEEGGGPHRRGEEVRADGERLAELDVGRAERGDDLAELNGALHLLALGLAAPDVPGEAGEEAAGDGAELEDALGDGERAALPIGGDRSGVVAVAREVGGGTVRGGRSLQTR